VERLEYVEMHERCSLVHPECARIYDGRHDSKVSIVVTNLRWSSRVLANPLYGFA
jgi:hypothetical protein